MTSIDLTGRTALVTGGAQGLGEAMAIALAGAGATVMIADIQDSGEQTAKALADKYGADVEKARFAALLHDSTKRLSMEEQLAMCEHYHIVLDELEQHALKLLHAKTGAALARDVFGADDEIYNAILWHTTGKANMTLLEKVIYLADYIEPNRDFDGVEDLRKVVWEDLDKGLEMGLAMTVEEMEQMGNPVHHNTLQALEYLRGHTHE